MRPFYLLDQSNNPCSTVQALRGYLSLVKLFFYYLVGPTIIIPGARPGLNVVINPYKLALLPTASRDKAFLVIVMQFSIGKIIKRRQNSITVYQIDRTGYHFRNQWATLI